jgi:hypothetical protein
VAKEVASSVLPGEELAGPWNKRLHEWYQTDDAKDRWLDHFLDDIQDDTFFRAKPSTILKTEEFPF